MTGDIAASWNKKIFWSRNHNFFTRVLLPTAFKHLLFLERHNLRTIPRANMNQRAQRSSGNGLSDVTINDRDADSPHDGKEETHEKIEELIASSPSGKVESKLSDGVLEITEPLGSHLSWIDITYLCTANGILKFEKKKIQVNSAGLQDSSKRLLAFSVNHRYSPGQETTIVLDSLSALGVVAGALRMNRGLLLKSWIQIEARIEDGKVFIGDKSYYLGHARLLPNS